MRNYLYAARFLLAVAVGGGLAGLGCTDNSGNGPGNPGAGGSGTGSAGTTGSGGGTAGTTGAGGTAAGGSGGAGGATPGFMSVLPCTSESLYVTGTTISFPTSATDFSYTPKCLKVPAGTTVTFSGDFGSHPLFPSSRGDQTGSPIVITSSNPDGGMTKDFTFSTPGFFAYFCAEHDMHDTGMFMDGVVWVQ